MSSSFIHSFCQFPERPFKSNTIQRCSRLQHGYCIGVSHRSDQATVGKGLVQGPHVAARAGVELMTLQLKVIDSTKAPPRLVWLPVMVTIRSQVVLCLHPAVKAQNLHYDKIPQMILYAAFQYDFIAWLLR